MLNPIEGEMFCVDKPLGWTSFAVVKKVRGTLRKMLGSGNVKVGSRPPCHWRAHCVHR